MRHGFIEEAEQDMYFPHTKKGVDEVCSLRAAQGVLVCKYHPLQTKQGTKVLLFDMVCTWCDLSLTLSLTHW